MPRRSPAGRRARERGRPAGRGAPAPVSQRARQHEAGDQGADDHESNTCSYRARRMSRRIHAPVKISQMRALALTLLLACSLAACGGSEERNHHGPRRGRPGRRRRDRRVGADAARGRHRRRRRVLRAAEHRPERPHAADQRHRGRAAVQLLASLRGDPHRGGRATASSRSPPSSSPSARVPGSAGRAPAPRPETAFKIEDGKIVEWRRVVGEGDDAERSAGAEQLNLSKRQARGRYFVRPRGLRRLRRS